MSFGGGTSTANAATDSGCGKNVVGATNAAFFVKYRQFPATLIFRFRPKSKNYEADTKAIRRTLIFSRFFDWSMQ